MHRGKLILVVGPTGSGKGTLIEYIRELHPELVLSVSCTTRKMRPGEQEGREYHFITEDEFKQRIAADDFLEWAQFGGNYYGTPKGEIESRLSRGETVLHELEVQGARQVKQTIPADQLAIIFIDAGPWDDLEHRVRMRAPISDAELRKRKDRYDDEMSFRVEATHVVKNPEGEVEQAKQDFAKVVESLLI